MDPYCNFKYSKMKYIRDYQTKLNKWVHLISFRLKDEFTKNN